MYIAPLCTNILHNCVLKHQNLCTQYQFTKRLNSFWRMKLSLRCPGAQILLTVIVYTMHMPVAHHPVNNI